MDGKVQAPAPRDTAHADKSFHRIFTKSPVAITLVSAVRGDLNPHRGDRTPVKSMAQFPGNRGFRQARTHMAAGDFHGMHQNAGQPSQAICFQVRQWQSQAGNLSRGRSSAFEARFTAHSPPPTQVRYQPRMWPTPIPHPPPNG